MTGRDAGGDGSSRDRPADAASADAAPADAAPADAAPADAAPADAAPARPGVARGPVRQRSWAEVRWRQLRNPPRPIVRAVASSLFVAVVLGLAYLAYDVAIARGARPPGGDLRTLAVAAYVLAVLVAGTVVTYLVVPQPTGGGIVRRRSGWSAALGFFAAVPIAYLVLVALTQIVEPFLV